MKVSKATELPERGSQQEHNISEKAMICTSNTNSAIESFHTAQEGSIETVQYERGAARGSECRTEEVSSRASSQHLSSWHPQMPRSVPRSQHTRSRMIAHHSSAGAATPHRPSRAPICILGRRPSAVLSALSGAQPASKWLCRLAQASPAAMPAPATGQPGSLPKAEQPVSSSEAQTPQKVLFSEAQPARKRLCREASELSPAKPSPSADKSVSLDAAEQPPAKSIKAEAQTAQKGLSSPQAAMQGPLAGQPVQEPSEGQSACSPASSSPKKSEMREGLHGELDTAAGSPTHRSEVSAQQPGVASLGTGLQPREQTAVSRRRLSFFAQLHKPIQVPHFFGSTSKKRDKEAAEQADKKEQREAGHRFRQAYVNARLAQQWAAGQPWAELDISGVPWSQEAVAAAECTWLEQEDAKLDGSSPGMSSVRQEAERAWDAFKSVRMRHCSSQRESVSKAGIKSILKPAAAGAEAWANSRHKQCRVRLQEN